MTQIALSRYTAPDTTLIGAATYTPDVGPSWDSPAASWAVFGNKALAPGGTANAMQLIDVGITDYINTCVWQISTSGFAIGGNAIRATGTGDGWFVTAECLGTTDGYLAIREITGGVSVLQASTFDAGIKGSTTTVTITVSGASLTGVLTSGVTVSFTMGTHLLETKCGLYCYTASGVFGLNAWDDFEVNGSSSPPPLVLSASISTRSRITCTMTASGVMSGASPTRSRATAVMGSPGVVASTCRTRSKTSGSMLSNGALAGQASGRSIPVCLLKGNGILLGMSSGRSNTSGLLSSPGALSGDVLTRSRVAGAMSGTAVLAALVRSMSRTVAIQSGSVTALSAVVHCMSSMHGALSVQGVLSGFIGTRSSVHGSMQGSGYMSSLARGRSVAGGRMIGTATLSGMARGRSMFVVLDIIIVPPVFEDLDNYPYFVSTEFIGSLRPVASNNMPDDCLIYDLVQVYDSLRTLVNTYVPRAKPVKGRLQYIPRVPRTPTVGDSSISIGDYIIKLPWDTDMLQTARIQVNGGKFYEVQVVDRDKYDRITVSAYCNQLTDKSLV